MGDGSTDDSQDKDTQKTPANTPAQNTLIKRCEWIFEQLLSPSQEEYSMTLDGTSLANEGISAIELVGGNRSEVVFVDAILKFLRSGETTHLSKEDSYSWAAQLVRTARQEEDDLLEESGAAPKNKKKDNVIAELSFTNWRNALLSLKSSYPIGKV